MSTLVTFDAERGNPSGRSSSVAGTNWAVHFSLSACHQACPKRLGGSHPGVRAIHEGVGICTVDGTIGHRGKNEVGPFLVTTRNEAWDSRRVQHQLVRAVRKPDRAESHGLGRVGPSDLTRMPSCVQVGSLGELAPGWKGAISATRRPDRRCPIKAVAFRAVTL